MEINNAIDAQELRAEQRIVPETEDTFEFVIGTLAVALTIFAAAREMPHAMNGNLSTFDRLRSFSIICLPVGSAVIASRLFRCFFPNIRE